MTRRPAVFLSPDATDEQIEAFADALLPKPVRDPRLRLGNPGPDSPGAAPPASPSTRPGLLPWGGSPISGPA
jgi:hypothetical protein